MVDPCDWSAARRGVCIPGGFGGLVLRRQKPAGSEREGGDSAAAVSFRSDVYALLRCHLDPDILDLPEGALELGSIGVTEIGYSAHLLSVFIKQTEGVANGTGGREGVSGAASTRRTHTRPVSSAQPGCLIRRVRSLLRPPTMNVEGGSGGHDRVP